MQNKIIYISLLIIIGALIFSCSANPTEQNIDFDSIRTQAVSTFASSLTETLAAVPTLSFTPVATFTITPTPLTETPLPTATTNPCYNLLYIRDVTIPDGMQMKAGEVFTKTWEVQNIGGCAWRAGFTFQHVGGELMRGDTVTLTEAIPTGAKRPISVELVVPSGINGLIQSSWRMADENGVFFGDTLSVNIVVGNITTPTP
ncbi:MAG: NBR1-Ig-like domain-containing protein [Anaerolineales bacterium]